MRELVTRSAACLLILGIFLIQHVERQNELTQLRLKIPQIDNERRALREKALQLRGEVLSGQTPSALLSLLERPEFSHLEDPPADRIWIVESEESDRQQGEISPSGRG